MLNDLNERGWWCKNMGLVIPIKILFSDLT
jgi:hypothetical protein